LLHQHRDNMNKVEQLCKSYLEGEISLKDFQFRLEPMLGSYGLISIEDEEFIKKTINELELTLYTIPDSQQKDKVVKMLPSIIAYSQAKANQ
jgi:hypothetical protein